ncbi:MAG TPA: TetR/AcrR family transcriptional regulator [Candidatus Saccharimonadales bacterium]|jgi:TetR/AcrR family transcriptional regulator|nr:TetR/AcrR family transcriptional regulator [Candidatus Saccharimonadales bacterium]
MTATPARIGKSGTRGEPEKTRAAILTAALEEFAHEGVAGARTDEIARSAGVNKALIYYYFKDKDGLYSAVLEQVFVGLYSMVNLVLDRPDLGPREKLLLYAGTHFDYIASSPLYPRLVQAEFMRTGYCSSSLLGRILERHGRPVYDKLTRLIAAGAKSGKFRAGIDPAQTLTSILGTIVFYFISIPAQQLMSAGDPFARERIVERRAAVLDFISAAVFSSPGPQKGRHK